MTFDELKAQKQANPRQSSSTHGSNSKYRQGCRCAPCKNSHNAHAREYYRIARGEIRPRADIKPVSQTLDGCQHHWKIDSPDGPESRGVCVKCFEIRMFRNSGNDVKSERTGGWF